MGLLNLFRSTEKIQQLENEKVAKMDLSKYHRVSTHIAGLKNGTKDSAQWQASVENLKKGDVLKIIQSRNRGKQKIEVFAPSGEQVGSILQDLVDDLTIKEGVDQNRDIDYDDEDNFNILSGFAVVTDITDGGKKKYSCNIDLYYKLI